MKIVDLQMTGSEPPAADAAIEAATQQLDIATVGRMQVMAHRAAERARSQVAQVRVAAVRLWGGVRRMIL